MVEREIIIEKLRTLYDEVVQLSTSVINTFNDFFGENRVDVQDYHIKSFESIIQMFEDASHSEILGRYNIGGQFEEFKEGLESEMDSTIFRYMPDIRILDIPRYRDFIMNNIKSNTHFLIIVWWDKVTITNDNDRSVEIEDLYAKMEVRYDGRMRDYFTLNRTTYPLIQWISDYAHSHLYGINKGSLSSFRSPCLGSGPIIATIETLLSNYEINIWGLFCQELDNYVHVESIAGVPYRYLEKIGTGDAFENGENIETRENLNSYGHFPSNFLRNTLKKFLTDNHIMIAYKNGAYYLGEPFVAYWLRLSNFIIDEYNEWFDIGRASHTIGNMRGNEFMECIISNNTVYKSTTLDNINSALDKVGTIMFKFKGVDKRLSITNISELSANNRTYLVNKNVATFLLTKVLKFINLKYGKQAETNIVKIL